MIEACDEQGASVACIALVSTRGGRFIRRYPGIAIVSTIANEDGIEQLPLIDYIRPTFEDWSNFPASQCSPLLCPGLPLVPQLLKQRHLSR